MSILKDIKTNSPTEAMMTALALQQACAEVGFDWKRVEPVFDKVTEEVDEIKEALHNPQKDITHVEDELGDLFFACINLARHLKVDPRQSLQLANEKFKSRFQTLEKLNQEQQARNADKRQLQEMSEDELEQLWQAAKRKKV